MNIRITFISLSLLIGLSSCEMGQNKELAAYFDLSKFLKDQVIMLNSEKPLVQKTVRLDGKTEKKELRMDSAGWLRELDIFIGANINKPSLVNAFEMETSQSQIIYSRKIKDADGVQRFEIKLMNDSIPGEIFITTSTRNSLYHDENSLRISFKDDKGQLKLSDYSITGSQTSLSLEPTTYQVDAVLQYN
ncbi:MAG: hypothetical protein O2887_14665 [Bacteroidetes bacterium]|nr:hypothetical protein [Bacteroidota bacterium]MDA1121711.1 hypothetical protein [Bacteroidota bacterium]